MSYDRQIDTSRHKRGVGIQYRHESKEDTAGFIPKPVARPEYGMIYQHKGIVTSTVFESKDEPTQMTKQSFTIIYFITYKKNIHLKLICKNVHS